MKGDELRAVLFELADLAINTDARFRTDQTEEGELIFSIIYRRDVSDGIKHAVQALRTSKG